MNGAGHFPLVLFPASHPLLVVIDRTLIAYLLGQSVAPLAPAALALVEAQLAALGVQVLSDYNLSRWLTVEVCPDVEVWNLSIPPHPFVSCHLFYICLAHLVLA